MKTWLLIVILNGQPSGSEGVIPITGLQSEAACELVAKAIKELIGKAAETACMEDFVVSFPSKEMRQPGDN